MALEGANIAGQAQVYNQTQKAVDVYTKTLAQQQAKLAAEQKALQDDLSKVKVEGIRQADMPEFLESYNKSKEIFAKLNATRNPAEKIKLKREFDESMINTGAIGTDSKELAKGEEAATKMFMNPNIRDRYKEEATKQFQLSKTLSRKDPRYIRDLSTLEQQVDLSKIMAELDKVDNELFKGEKSNLIETKGSRGGVSGFYVMEERKLSPERQALAYSAQFDLQPSFRVAMREVFPQFAELNNDELKAAVIPELVKQRAKSIYGDKKFDETGMSEYQRRSLAMRGNDGGSPKDYVVEEINLTTDPKEDKDFNPIPGTEEQSINLKKAVQVRSVSFPSIQTKAYDVANKKMVNLPAKQDLKLAALAYVPTNASDGRYELQAVVIDSNNKQFVVPESKVPVDIRGTDAYKSARTALGSAPPPRKSKSSGNAVKTNKPVKAETKKYTAAEEKLISDNLEANPAYTRDEIIKALGL
jgi:hypothetical protein